MVLLDLFLYVITTVKYKLSQRLVTDVQYFGGRERRSRIDNFDILLLAPILGLSAIVYNLHSIVQNFFSYTMIGTL